MSSTCIPTQTQTRLPGPTPNSNYLLEDRILFGWYVTDPASSGNYSNNVDLLIKTNRDVFINLTTSAERQGFYDYIPRVKSQIPDAMFLSFEIPDCGIPQDLTSFTKFILELKGLFDQGKKLFIHCRGGHGRSGLVTACLLISMNWTAENALFEVKMSHLSRMYYPEYPCPQTEEQVEFVKNFENVLDV